MGTPKSTPEQGLLTGKLPRQSTGSRDPASFTCGRCRGRGFPAEVSHVSTLPNPTPSTLWGNVKVSGRVTPAYMPPTQERGGYLRAQAGLRKVLGDRKWSSLGHGASFPEGCPPTPSFPPHSRIHFSPSARGKKACGPVGQGQPPSPVGAFSPQSLLPVASPKQVSTLALGSQVFSQPAPPHLIAFQSANPWPTPSAPAGQATSVWPAGASETSHGPHPSLGQPLDSPCPNHIRLALPHTSDAPLTNTSKPCRARSSPGPKQPTDSSPAVPLAPRRATSRLSGKNN